MTLTVCLKGVDGLVLASDSRGTFGDPRDVTAQNDTITKLYLIRNVGFLTAGSQNGNMVLKELKEVADKEKIEGVTTIMEKLREISRRQFGTWFPAFPFMPTPGQNPSFMRPTLHFIIGGYDDAKTPLIYSMVSNLDFSPNLHDFGYALGGVAQYALYLLNRLYSPTMNVECLVPLAAYVVTETATQDGKVGGPVQLGVTKHREAYLLKREDIDKIVSENEERSANLRKLFVAR